MKLPALPDSPRYRALLLGADSRLRGAAFVEALVVISFLTLMLASILYFGRYFEARQQALAVARQCAWAYSRNACQEDPKCGEPGHFPCLPPICATLFRIEREPDLELRNKVAEAQALAQASGAGSARQTTVAAQERFREGVADKIAKMLELLVGEYVYASGSSTIEGSASLPNARTELSVDYFLPCNLQHEDGLGMAVELFGKLKPVSR